MTRDMERRPRGSGLAIALIVVGVLILLANFGLFDWFTISRLASLWPVLLVAIGADMLTRGRYRLVVWGAALVLGALLYAYDGVGFRGGGAGGVVAETHAIVHPLAGARSAEVHLTTGVGTLTLADLASGADLAQGTVWTGRGETLVDELARDGSTAVLTLATQQQSGFNLPRNERRGWDLKLTREVPIALDLNSGVGQVRLELQRLQLRSLNVQAGVGEVDVTLPERGVYRADVKAGVGALRVAIPAGIAARVTVKTGLGQVRVNGTFTHSGDVYETPDYATATDRVDLRVEGGLGQITVTH